MTGEPNNGLLISELKCLNKTYPSQLSNNCLRELQRIVNTMRKEIYLWIDCKPSPQQCKKFPNWYKTWVNQFETYFVLKWCGDKSTLIEDALDG